MSKGGGVHFEGGGLAHAPEFSGVANYIFVVLERSSIDSINRNYSINYAQK